MESFNPDWACNGSDDGGRYTYRRQPGMVRWNCERLAEAIQDAAPLPRLRAILKETYDGAFEAEYRQRMRRKLGLMAPADDSDANAADDALFESLFDTMRQTGADFTEVRSCTGGVSVPSRGPLIRHPASSHARHSACSCSCWTRPRRVT